MVNSFVLLCMVIKQINIEITHQVYIFLFTIQNIQTWFDSIIKLWSVKHLYLEGL